MPIYKLTTDIEPTFLRLAKIKKGERHDDGSMTNLDYFRVIFEKGCEDVETAFRAVYKDKPVRINFRLAFNSVERCWDANYVCYAAGGQYARAASSKEKGLYWLWYMDYATKKVWIRDSSAITPDGVELMRKPIDLSQPVFQYKERKTGEIHPVFLEMEGRLNIVVPEVANIDGKPRVGYFEFCPGTARDIRTISTELAGIEYMANELKKDLSGIPMVLTRREEMMPRNYDGKRTRAPEWVVHIEVGGEWGGKALEAMQLKALPSPEDDFVDAVAVDVEEPEEEYQPPDFSVPSPAPAPTQASVSDPEPDPEPEPGPKEEAFPKEVEEKVSRPYQPSYLKAQVIMFSTILPALYEKRGEKLTVTDKERNILASVLDTTFGGDKNARHLFCEWLFGVTSTKELTPAQVKALWKAMGIKSTPDRPAQFDDIPSELSIKEFVAALKVASLGEKVA